MVLINVGVTAKSEKIAVKDQKGFNANQVPTMISFFVDQKVVDYIPEKDDYFMVEKYKKELTKTYSKIDSYLCKVHDISEQSDTIEFDNNKFTNPQISGIFDDNNNI